VARRPAGPIDAAVIRVHVEGSATLARPEGHRTCSNSVMKRLGLSLVFALIDSSIPDYVGAISSACAQFGVQSFFPYAGAILNPGTTYYAGGPFERGDNIRLGISVQCGFTGCYGHPDEYELVDNAGNSLTGPIHMFPYQSTPDFAVPGHLNSIGFRIVVSGPNPYPTDPYPHVLFASCSAEEFGNPFVPTMSLGGIAALSGLLVSLGLFGLRRTASRRGW